ncbi:hypothetical protein [Candidatus Rariloculus sp.]|uniref:hypothetical protein n=1 Tax=Candidatus Rariloculus sp. TaxID=3101265 RepID=UPI003D09CF3D
MIKRILFAGGLIIGASLAGGLNPTAVAQEPDWEHPMTPWGEPDLQGMWPLNHLIGVGLQRNPEFGDRLYMTDEEFEVEQESVQQRDERFVTGTIPVADAAGRAMRQTSLIVDPPDGQFPPLTEYGEQLQANMRSTYRPGQTVFDGISDFSAWDRCITRGMPVSMLPRNYNNGIEIIQSPGHVVLLVEMAHEARIIPTGNREPLDPAIRQWLGDPRGRWEGNTLVVETTNYNGRVGKTSAGVPGSPRPLQPSTPNMRTIERFTRVSDEQIDYELVVEDPEVLASGSFTVQYPMFLDNDYVAYEYACHEGNTAIRNYIETSRFEQSGQSDQ